MAKNGFQVHPFCFFSPSSLFLFQLLYSLKTRTTTLQSYAYRCGFGGGTSISLSERSKGLLHKATEQLHNTPAFPFSLTKCKNTPDFLGDERARAQGGRARAGRLGYRSLRAGDLTAKVTAQLGLVHRKPALHNHFVAKKRKKKEMSRRAALEGQIRGEVGSTARRWGGGTEGSEKSPEEEGEVSTGQGHTDRPVSLSHGEGLPRLLWGDV